MNSGFGVVADMNLRFLMYDCKTDKNEALSGKNVTDEIGGEGREWAERHLRKISWVGCEAAIER